MNDQKNKYKKFENQTFTYRGEKIFIQKIKELSELIIIHIAGDTLQFTKDNIQNEFFDQISSKFDVVSHPKPEVIEVVPKPLKTKPVPKDTILQEAAEYLNSSQKTKTEKTLPAMNTQDTAPVQISTENNEVEPLNNLDSKLNSTGIFTGFDTVRDSLLNALKKIQSTESAEQLETALQESKAVYDISTAVNDMAKTKVQAAGLLMKYGSK